LRSLEETLAFDRAQLGRSATEQAVANSLRPIFGTDLSSDQAQFYAGQIRVNEELKQFSSIGRELTSGFLSDLKSGLRDGASGWDAFANAGANALDRLADKALGMVADGIFDMILGAVLGGVSGGFGGGGGRVGSFSIGGMPSYANGTSYHPGGLARINEKDRGEILDLPSGTRVIPHDVSKAMAQNGSLGGQGVQVVYAPTINGAGMTMAQLQATLAADRADLAAEFPAMYQNAVRRAAING